MTYLEIALLSPGNFVGTIILILVIGLVVGTVINIAKGNTNGG